MYTNWILYEELKKFFRPLRQKYRYVLLRPLADSVELQGADRFFIDLDIRHSNKTLFISGYYRPKSRPGDSATMYNMRFDTDLLYSWLTTEKLDELLRLTEKYVDFFRRWEDLMTKLKMFDSQVIPVNDDEIPYEYTAGLKNLDTEAELLYL